MNQTSIQAQIMVCWMLCKNRNDAIWNQRGMVACEIVNSVLSTFNQWRSVQDKIFDNFLVYMLPDDGLEQWHSPMEHRIKVNTDAALFDNPNRYSHAIIVRDHTGTLVQAKSTCLQGSVDPEFAEAAGVREDLSWVKNIKFTDVIVETDCLQVV